MSDPKTKSRERSNGGKPDRAQAGGRNPDALETALAGAKDLV
jgi:hypothetical protein